MFQNTLKHINDLIARAVGFLMSLCVASMALLIISSVIIRNTAGMSIQWIVDVNRLLFIWMCFLGIVYINDKDMLIRFDILDRHYTDKLAKVMHFLQQITALTFFYIMTKAGILVSDFAKVQFFSTIPVSTKWLYIPVVFAGSLLVFQTISKLLYMLPGRKTQTVSASINS